MDEMLEIEELRARNKILEEIYDICTDCRAGSMIAPPCEDMKKEIKQLKDELSQLQQLKDEDSLRVVQLASELEQEKALKDTYFALYHTKHEDLAKEYEQLKHKEQKLEQYKKSKQASYEALQKKCNELELENRKLKAEKEELQKENANLESIIDGKNGTIGWFKDRLDQYYEIISKIREAAGLKQSMFDAVMVLEELLQKISEAHI